MSSHTPNDAALVRKKLWLALAAFPLVVGLNAGCEDEVSAEDLSCEEEQTYTKIDIYDSNYCGCDRYESKLPKEKAWEDAIGTGTVENILGCPHPLGYQKLDRVLTQQARDKGNDCICHYFYESCCLVGRPLTDGTHNAVALVSSDPAWGSEDFQGDEAFKLHLANVSELMRAELSQEWLRDALFEHASVASFARAALELMQHGAPPHLLKATLKAGLDEVTHARLCFGLASAYAGTPLGAGSMPDMPAVRSQTLAQLAVDVFLEGAVEESTAVLVAVRAAAGCEVPAAHRAQTRIADDETTHAALAWATIAWALQTGGDPVRDALLAAIQAIENQIAQTRLPLSAPDPWLIHGRLPPEAQQQARIDAWHGIIKPTCTRLLGACFERMENQVVTRRTV